ncbi:MAG: hypothetical protein IPJ61_21550 [Tessaracoccus sp.]|uniref:hypothetical protein n=1 Tax=Tessaracoccus sp. TaxID=1971211 RepID=UPI001EB19ECC|nr:hypothetical protein [Tessaracoccus sp.]MBK7823575.1 hypothetical protein [Tessaracoccus sp.]
MASHLLWFRLPKGRVWHVACSGAQVALCGQSIPARGERQPKRPPFGARPCPDCDNVSAQVEFAMCDALRIRYEQEHPEDPGPYQHRIIPMQSSEPLLAGLTVTDVGEDEGDMVSRAFLGTPLPMVVEPSMTGNQVIVGDFGGES